MSHAAFVHLRVRSCYSLLESTVRLEALLERCRRERMPAVAIADRANLFGALEFSESAAKAGIQPIDRLPAADRRPRARAAATAGRPAPALLPVLVQNQDGYRNLLKLLEPGLPRRRGRQRAGARARRSERRTRAGLIALTGGSDGPVGRALASGNRGLGRGLLERLAGMFPGRLYVELMRHGLEVEDAARAGADRARARASICRWSRPTTSISSRRPSARPHDVLLCIAEGAQVGQERAAPADARASLQERRRDGRAVRRSAGGDRQHPGDRAALRASWCRARRPILPAFPDRRRAETRSASCGARPRPGSRRASAPRSSRRTRPRPTAGAALIASAWSTSST